MTYEDVKVMLDELDVDTAYYSFDNAATDVAPPFVCFYYPSSDNFLADDTVYQRIDNLYVELYTDSKDFALEKQLEDILDEHHLIYDKTESYIQSEHMYQTLYTMQIDVTY